MALRDAQAAIKDQYRAAPEEARITLTASASSTDEHATACSVDLGRAIYAAQAHAGVGGAGTAACSGDLLLAALAACAQLTCQMAAEASGIPLREVRVTVEGDLDLRGTLGMSREAPVGFAAIRVQFDLDAPEATERQRRSLQRATEAFCVVMQTLTRPPAIETRWS